MEHSAANGAPTPPPADNPAVVPRAAGSSGVPPAAGGGSSTPAHAQSGNDSGHAPRQPSRSERSRAASLDTAAKAVIPLDVEAPPQVRQGHEVEKPEVAELPEDTAPKRRWRPRLLSMGTSALVHAAALIVMAIITVAGPSGEGEFTLQATLNATAELEPEALILETNSPTLMRETGDTAVEPSHVVDLDTSDIIEPVIGERSPHSATGGEMLPSDDVDLTAPIERIVGGGLEGRSPENRPRLAVRAGATRESEAAVEAGLRWLVAHQSADGSWNFDHRKSFCHGQCTHPGSEKSTTGATGLALLPFLGAGYTHLQGEHKEAVRRGLYYLMQRGRVTEHGIDLQEGTMYAQALASLAVSEAYAMTEDEALRGFAQQAVDFIVYAQDPEGGGWRYHPQEPGDTTVTGWQLMALKSGEIARLHVPRNSFYHAQHFLDGVQAEGGALYGYLTSEPRPSTTAIGLLCRMYGGWTRYNPSLQKGIQVLDHWGPSRSDMYYNYYATQVMRHWNGPEWPDWNRQMRDYLVENQCHQGHASGSWYFEDPHVDSGGRLYTTCLAIMILEVYYRYMPLYGEEAFRP